MLLLRIADINLLFKSDLKGLKIGYPQKNFIHSTFPQSSPQKGVEAKKKVPSPQRGEGQGEGEIIDCTISIEHHPLPFNIKDKEIFIHAGPWKLFRNRKGYKIAFFFPALKPDYYMLAEFKRDFSRVRLYIKDADLRYAQNDKRRAQNDNKKTFIISHPLDQLLVINLLSRGRGVMIHSCCVNDNGRGFLYAGTSRSGKSTTAKLWLKQTKPSESPHTPLWKRDNPPSSPFIKGGIEGDFKDMTGVKVLSDDRIIIREFDDKIYAYGTPWHGEVNVCDPGRVEIERIFFLQHSTKNYVKSLPPVDAATRMFVRCFPTFWDKEGMAFTLKFIDEVVRKVPCYEFGFVPDKSAVNFVRGLR